MTSTTLSTYTTGGITLTATGAYGSPFTITQTGTIFEATTPDGIVSSLAGAYLLNQGSIFSRPAGHVGNSVYFLAGGTFVNQGVAGGGNIAGARIENAPGTVLNTGTILGGVGIGLSDGGYVANTGTAAAIIGDAEAIAANGTLTLVNQGLISSTQLFSIDFESGTLENTGIIIGGPIDSNAQVADSTTIANAGSILTSIYFEAGGTLINTGTISGYGAAGVYMGHGGNLLEAGQGAVFHGTILAAGTANTLELSGAGALAGLGTSVTGFQTLAFDPGAAWTLSGTTAGLATGQTITGFGGGDGIDLTSFAATGFTYVSGTGLELTSAAGPIITLAIAATPDFTPGFTITTDGTNTAITAPGGTFSVSNQAELNQAIAFLDSTAALGTYAIDFAASITEGTDTGDTIAFNGTTIAAVPDLFAFNLAPSVAVTLDGFGNTLSGADSLNALFVFQGDVTVENLTIANAVAIGGAGSEGGAGLGGGLFVAGANSLTAGGDVTLFNTAFENDSAIGGAGNASVDGGGGLDGGPGGSLGDINAGGGIGPSAYGGADQVVFTNGMFYNTTFPPGPGIILGAPSTGKHALGGGGGSNGGSAGIYKANGTIFGYDFGGGGGNEGVGGQPGGFGGGGGNGLAGGFGGGGGGTVGSGAYGSAGFGGGFYGGGGGLGAGADVFVQQGATLAIAGGELGLGTVAGGTASNPYAPPGHEGAGLGTGIFLQGNQSVTLGAPAGAELTVSGQITDESGATLPAFTGTGTGAGALVITGPGTVALDAANAFTGGITLAAGTLQLGMEGAAGTGAIRFAGDATLQFAAANAPANFLAGFSTLDAIDITDLPFTKPQTLTIGAGGKLEVAQGSTTLNLTFAAADSGMQLTTSADAGSGTILEVTCFCAGTRIRAEHGEIPVEHLQIGDKVKTRHAGMQPIKWIGTRRYAAPFCNHPKVLPIRITASAIGPGVPSRDLYLSPGHALALGGALIHAGRLVNGTTITQLREAQIVEYFHIELETHEIILAENTPAETFLGENFRNQFQNAADFHARYGQSSAPEHPCLPRLESGPRLAAILGRLHKRPQTTAPGPLHAIIDIATPTQCAGWAINPACPAEPARVEILGNGRRLAVTLANAPRPDVAAAGHPATNCGFAVRLPQHSHARLTVLRAAA